jgi:hypothetical protein
MLGVAWCAVVLPALFIAESGARLNLSERALVAAPMAVASALLVIGGRLGQRSNSRDAAERGSAMFAGAVIVGILTGAAALVTLLALA